MLKKIINRETIAYLICGLLTTILNIIIFDLLNRKIGQEQVFWSESIAFVISTLFAYIVNKQFVFHKKTWARKTMAKEASTFFGGRIVSYFVDLLLVILARDILQAGQYEIFHINGLTIAKIPIAAIVIIINYIFSKTIVFANKKHPS